jgi:hypothetical protein
MPMPIIPLGKQSTDLGIIEGNEAPRYYYFECPWHWHLGGQCVDGHHGPSCTGLGEVASCVSTKVPAFNVTGKGKTRVTYVEGFHCTNVCRRTNE